MTIYSELMSKRLEENRIEVDKLFNAQYIIGKVSKIEADLKELGATVRFENACVNIGRDYAKKHKPDFKEIKILLDEAIFSDPRLETRVDDGHTWKYIIVTDTNNGGKYNIDINMDAVKCKKVEVKRTVREVEDVEYRWECE
jgi:hypothetical protein